MDAAKYVRRKLIGKGLYAQATALDQVVCGGSFKPLEKCPHCGSAQYDLEHYFYTCPIIESFKTDDPDGTITRSAWIHTHIHKKDLEDDWSDKECLIYRGLIPYKAWAKNDIGTEPPRPKEVEIGDFWQAVANNGTIYTDGAGAPSWVPKKAARVGSGAAAIDFEVNEDGSIHLRNIGILILAVPGKQTVPRAETWAAHRATQHTHDVPRTIVSDASYVVNGINKVLSQVSAKSLLTGTNADIWYPLFHTLTGENPPRHTES